LAERERLHIQEAFSLYGTHACLLAARGDMESAKRFLDNLESMIECDSDERRFEQIIRLVTKYDPSRSLVGLFSKALGRRAEPKRRRT